MQMKPFLGCPIIIPIIKGLRFLILKFASSSWLWDMMTITEILKQSTIRMTKSLLATHFLTQCRTTACIMNLSNQCPCTRRCIITPLRKTYWVADTLHIRPLAIQFY